MSACGQVFPRRRTPKHRVVCFAVGWILSMTCVHAIAQELPKVAVLSTGGTIASRQDAVKGGYVPVLSAEDLVAAVPAIKKIAQIQAEQISNIPSPDMTPEIWLGLATRVNELLAKPEITGIVVTHGTDTLEETAYFLDLTNVSLKPVIWAHNVPPQIQTLMAHEIYWTLFASRSLPLLLARASWWL